MKNLIFINGSMGTGKTTVSRELQNLLPNCVFLDGDWCWDAKPFIVTAETTEMAIDNISTLLKNFLDCPAYENVVFCWVMQEQRIIQNILTRLGSQDYRFYAFTLICSERALIARLSQDVEAGKRSRDIIERSLAQLAKFEQMNTTKIDISVITAKQASQSIYDTLLQFEKVSY